MKNLTITLILMFLIGCGHKAPPPGKPDITPPAIRIIFPSNGDTVTEDTVRIRASISDSSKITKIQIILDGKTIVATENTDSLFFSIENLTDTAHIIILRAKDEWDNWGVSPAVRFFIKK